MPKPRNRPTPVPEVPQRRWATLKQAAQHYQIGERTLRQMIYDRRVTGYRIGPQLLRVDLNEIDAMIVPIGEPVPFTVSTPPPRGRKRRADGETGEIDALMVPTIGGSESAGA